MSFLLSPSSPSGSASTSTSPPDSLTSSPGIAETNLTTVDGASKSRIIVPATPSDAQPSSSFVPPLIGTAAATQAEVVDTHADVDADHTTAAASTDAWHHRSRAQSDAVSPATTVQTTTTTTTTTTSHPGMALKISFADPPVVPERSPTASSSGYSSASSSSSSATGSRDSSAESSSVNESVSSSSTERSRWPTENLGSRSIRAGGKLPMKADGTAGGSSRSRSRSGASNESLRSALSSTPRIRMPESLLFSHSIPPAATWKGKERERDPEWEREIRKERARAKAPQRHHRKRSSGSSTLSKIQTTRGDVVYKYEEQGISRDFLLIIALCIGLACGFVLIVRPAMLSLLGRAGSVNFSLDGLD